MLVELTLDPDEIERIRGIFEKENLGTVEEFLPFIKGDKEHHPSNGCYVGCEGMFTPTISVFKELAGKNVLDMGYLGFDENPSIIEDEEGNYIPNPNWFEQYGVCDNVEQVLAKYGERLGNDGHQYFIWFTPVFQDKSNAWKGGGWRWHKWGTYIGDLEPCCEYLDDEDFGEDWQGYVLCFHIYRIDCKDRRGGSAE